VAKDCVNHFFRVSAFAENFRAFVGMFLRGMMGGVGPAFVVEIVEQACEGPEIFVSAEFSRVRAGAGFQGESVFTQAFALRVFA
jgi:hypothetical protein